MLTVILIILMILACVFLALAAFGFPQRRAQWGWLGLLCWALVVTIGMLAGADIRVD